MWKNGERILTTVDTKKKIAKSNGSGRYICPTLQLMSWWFYLFLDIAIRSNLTHLSNALFIVDRIISRIYILWKDLKRKSLAPWQAVENMTNEQQRRLLFFWTWVKYLPSDGFSGLGCSKLLIFRASSSRDHLPTSQTCFYHLNLPAYTSLSMMQRRLHMIVQEHVSSGFGAS